MLEFVCATNLDALSNYFTIHGHYIVLFIDIIHNTIVFPLLEVIGIHFLAFFLVVFLVVFLLVFRLRLRLFDGLRRRCGLDFWFSDRLRRRCGLDVWFWLLKRGHLILIGRSIKVSTVSLAGCRARFGSLFRWECLRIDTGTIALHPGDFILLRIWTGGVVGLDFLA
jgi:hypothetical protein